MLLMWMWVSILFIERQKKRSKSLIQEPGVRKKPFGYRVIHHGYSLLSYPGH